MLRICHVQVPTRPLAARPLVALAISACGDGKSSRVDPAKAQLTAAQVQAREEAERVQAGKDLEVSNPSKPSANASPKVDAGPDIFSDANLLVDLPGTAPGELSFVRSRWVQIDGPEATLINPDQLQAQVVVPDVNQYTKLSFRLSATTADQQVASDTLDLFVYPSTTPPRLSAAA